MATPKGQSRRNGVIGFQMAGTPAPAIPLIAPRRNGPIGFTIMPGPSTTATASSSIINQGPPHRITPPGGPRHSPFLLFRTAKSGIEGKLKHARSQALALRSTTATQRSTSRLIDQQQMDAIIHQSTNNRLDQASEELELAEGDRDVYRQWKQNIAKDRNDVLGLRRIVAGLEYNMRHRERRVGAETRMQGLLNNMSRSFTYPQL
ncbi:unnamed protein product [Penicillium glandicola]